MVTYVLRRALQAMAVLLAVSLVVFMGLYAIGNPVDILLPDDATESERVAAIRALGLDQPIWTQYLRFLVNALHGDLSNSFVYNMPSIDLILQRLPATLELALAALFIALLIGAPLGLIAGLKPNTWMDKTITTGSILGFSLPNFWQGLMLILIFAVGLGWFPASGRGQTGSLFGAQTSFATLDGLHHLFLPALNLALFKMAMVIRLTRAQVREVMPMDFVRFARAKGLTERRIITTHVAKTIAAPIITVIGLEFGSMLAFAVVTESIFAWPGMGKLIIDSIVRLDRPVVAAYLLVITTLFVAINLVVDLLYMALDPRTRDI
ncbi:Dipeptide transport system permease protein DppB [Pigmentiphaga humi]|uniref:Dipeptide transport system permease protein DppB n=1 Tax=Pigmentiphaga humi TaxID=2478468 RepID=A0A3P4B5P0_9BURK|nr:ABC transporter permease [Pigmentiphaga humi]VCU70950.1 Dipeptide transport system permease protein DppB [Pigmentiphaga humi]